MKCCCRNDWPFVRALKYRFLQLLLSSGACDSDVMENFCKQDTSAPHQQAIKTILHQGGSGFLGIVVIFGTHSRQRAMVLNCSKVVLLVKIQISVNKCSNLHIFFVFKVQTKTVAQCVEFYYTYKRQVKIGRNGILTFGPPDSPGEKQPEAVVDVKVERLPHATQTPRSGSWGHRLFG